MVKVKAIRKTVEISDLREHNKLKTSRKMDDIQWDTIISGTTTRSTIFITKYGQYLKNVSQLLKHGYPVETLLSSLQ